MCQRCCVRQEEVLARLVCVPLYHVSASLALRKGNYEIIPLGTVFVVDDIIIIQYILSKIYCFSDAGDRRL